MAKVPTDADTKNDNCRSTQQASTPVALSEMISTDDVFAEVESDVTLENELHYGNQDLIRALQIAGIAGPFRVVSPWELEDIDGIRRIHAGGYAAVPLGERYPPLVEFLDKYLKHDRNMGLPQQSATAWRAALEHNLIKLLSSVAPSHADSQVFFSNSGAEAIEGAIKFVKAYRPNSKYLINFTGAYHGKTFGALSITPNNEYQALFKPLMPNVRTLKYGNIDEFLDTVKELGADNIAGVVLEPIQGEAGVIIPPLEFLETLGQCCQRYGIVSVADEIQVGLGRSGFHFASVEWGRFEPDIITLAKPLGGGMVPIGVTIARKAIYHNMLGGLASKRHSSTFGGNSLAMAIGLRSLELIIDNQLALRSRQLGEIGLARLESIQAQHDHLLEDVRGIGLLFALQFRPATGINVFHGARELIHELCGLSGLLALHKAGVHANLSLNAKRTVRLTPALNIPKELLDQMFLRIEQMADINHGSWQLIRHTSFKTLADLARLELGR